jgi:hypothetical protein
VATSVVATQHNNTTRQQNNTLFHLTELLYMIFCFTAFTATQGEWEYVEKESRMYEASLGQDSEPSTKQPLYDNNTYNIPGFLGDMQWTLSVIQLHFTAS